MSMADSGIFIGVVVAGNGAGSRSIFDNGMVGIGTADPTGVGSRRISDLGTTGVAVVFVSTGGGCCEGIPYLFSSGQKERALRPFLVPWEQRRSGERQVRYSDLTHVVTCVAEA